MRLSKTPFGDQTVHGPEFIDVAEAFHLVTCDLWSDSYLWNLRYRQRALSDIYGYAISCVEYMCDVRVRATKDHQIAVFA